MDSDSFIVLPYIINQSSIHVNSLIWDLNALNQRGKKKVTGASVIRRSLATRTGLIIE